ncbi:MAG TPA: amidohydrolase family protein, partial [Nitrososphaeraceae archaeon]|nr:amidohydrolase family protein [Nitrososphaeraceae archaeon]
MGERINHGVMEKGNIMNIVDVSFLSFLVFSSSEIMSDINLLAFGLTETHDNRSLLSLGTDHGSEIFVLHGATLIDGTGSAPKSDSVVIINGNKIIAITNQSENLDQYFNKLNGTQTGVRFLNLTGKYIMPGLFDMHAHVGGVLKDSYDRATSENMLAALLNHGITTIRNPGGPTNESVSLREDILSGKITGPEIFTAGRLLNTPELPIPFIEKQVTTEEEVIEEVRRQAASGVDFIKLYVGLNPELLKVAIDEAHHQGIKVIGHLYLTSWTEAANLGIDFLTHGVPVSPFLLSEGKQRIFNLTGGDPFDHSLWLDLVDLSSQEISNMIDSLVQNQIPVDPTLNVYEAILKQGTNDPQNQQRWNKVLLLTKIMHERGVQILSGTDIPNFELVPGKSLHHEL